MSAPWYRVRFKRGMALQVSILCWMIALLTLVIFVSAIIPEQKQDLRDALFSKARGVSSSLQEVTASAAVSEDYSSVVDQCNIVLSGDDAIDYLVITKNDGFSVIVDRKGWRTAELGAFWRPNQRTVSSGMGIVPDFNRRVFYFAKPFDYSAIQWGWIHVGLSLRSYDHSVGRIYFRTGALTVLCVLLSLIVSLVFARRQVKPVQSLQAAVHQVAQGNLSARADIHSGNEIEGLAHSFNLMTASILQRNEILESVRFTAQELLKAPDLRAVLTEVLRAMGQAAHASHVWVCQDCSRDISTSHQPERFEWAASNGHQGYHGLYSTCRWAKAETACADLHQQNGRAGAPCEKLQLPGGSVAKSLLLVPLVDNDVRLGFLGVDDCLLQREWSNAEQDCFRAAAGMIGSSIIRYRALQALQESRDMLEKRVEERTQELRQQVDERDRAHRELAAAQQDLIRLSRLSGMAEIATSVLHNVGNVLNSVNVSTTIVSDKIRELRVDQVGTLASMLQEHQPDIAEFVAKDPKGQRTLPYLVKLGTHFQSERTVMLEEMSQLQKHVEHIKGIISTQQNYAKVSGLVEELSLADLIEDACRIMHSEIERHRIHIERDFEPVPRISADKHTLIQILINLMRNAKDAIKQSDDPRRTICLRLRRRGPDAIHLQVIDSGVGIAPQNLTRIFSHGFTTKPDGHGFGLHCGALDARRMGGALWAESEGLGHGSTFTLELHLPKVTERNIN